MNVKRSSKSWVIVSRVIIGLALIAVLSFMFVKYKHRYDNRLALQNIVDNPEKFDGVVYQTSGRVIGVSPDKFFILDTEANNMIPVKMKNHNIKVGDNLIVLGTLYKNPSGEEWYFNAEKLRKQNTEVFKYIISVFAGVYLIYIFFKEWRLSWFYFEAKNEE